MSIRTETLPGRRRAIGLIGGGVVVASTGLVGCSSNTPDAAIQAWSQAANPSDPRRFMLAHALLAPNPHNRQPWLADLRVKDDITLVCDKDRLLPETDPFGRQILIGCGAFVELAVIAAAQLGYRVKVSLFPNGEPQENALPGGAVVAKLSLTADPSVPKDVLFAHIRRRRTNKNKYDDSRPLPTKFLSDLTSIGAAHEMRTGQVIEPTQSAQVRKLTREAFVAEMTTTRTWLETARLLRIGPTEIEQHRDGIAVMGTMPRVLDRLGLFDRFQTPKPGSTGYDKVMERWLPFETGSGYVWIASKGNSRISQMMAGRAYIRSQLQACADGIEMHPLSQALQEFAEVRPQSTALYSVLGLDPSVYTIQMLSRVGYALTPAQPTPRRDLEQLVMPSEQVGH